MSSLEVFVFDPELIAVADVACSSGSAGFAQSALSTRFSPPVRPV
jgi:hypothetical protein